jgi:uncharacterized tellurite resistance protein B-like protein
VLDVFNRIFGQQATEAPVDEAALHLAAAMLLIEVAKIDHSLDDAEIDRLSRVLREQWGIGDADLVALLEVAHRQSDVSVSLHQHLDQINTHYSLPQKQQLMLGLWHVAAADDEIHPQEEALLRRLADLMYLSHSDFIRAKHIALDIS